MSALHNAGCWLLPRHVITSNQVIRTAIVICSTVAPRGPDKSDAIVLGTVMHIAKGRQTANTTDQTWEGGCIAVTSLKIGSRHRDLPLILPEVCDRARNQTYMSQVTVQGLNGNSYSFPKEPRDHGPHCSRSKSLVHLVANAGVNTYPWFSIPPQS